MGSDLPLASLQIRRSVLIFVVFCTILIAAYGARHRTPWNDEGWFSSPAYNLAFNGYMGTTVLEPTFFKLTRIEQKTYWVMPLFLAGQGLWYKVFPHTLLGTRAFSLFWALVALLGFGALMKGLFPGTAMSRLACILLAGSFIFMDNAGFARPDMMCAALGICGLGAYVSLRERSLPLAMLAANAFIAASGLSHPNGVFHLLALGVLVLWLDHSRIRLPELAAAAIPYLLFAGLWSIYILQDKQAFIDQMTMNGANGSNSRWTPTWNPFLILKNEIEGRYVQAFGLATGGLSLIKLFALGAYISAIVLCVSSAKLRQMSSVQLLLVLLAVYFIAMAIFNQKLTYYLIHILPIYVALLAVAICWLWERWPRYRKLLVAGVVGLTILETSGIVAKAATRSYIAKQQEMLSFVRSQSRPGDLIVGTAALVYEMDFDPRLSDDPYLGVRSGRVPDVIILDSLLYAPLYAGWEIERPADMKLIHQRLSEYRKVRQIGDYEIYLRPERMVLKDKAEAQAK